MKIKNLSKFENDENIINVNFVTTSIEKQYTITIQYFVIEHLDLENGEVNVETVQTQTELINALRGMRLSTDERISIIHDCTRNIPPFTFKFNRPFTEYFMSEVGNTLKQFHHTRFEDTLGNKIDGNNWEVYHYNGKNIIDVFGGVDDIFGNAIPYEFYKNLMLCCLNEWTAALYEFEDDGVTLKAKCINK